MGFLCQIKKIEHGSARIQGSIYVWNGRRRFLPRHHLKYFRRFATFGHLIDASLDKGATALHEVIKSAQEVVYLKRARLYTWSALTDVELGVFLNDSHWYTIFGERKGKSKASWSCSNLQTQEMTISTLYMT